jgi:hypothetical protein
MTAAMFTRPLSPESLCAQVMRSVAAHHAGAQRSEDSARSPPIVVYQERVNAGSS